jgi:hypothetical protein
MFFALKKVSSNYPGLLDEDQSGIVCMNSSGVPPPFSVNYIRITICISRASVPFTMEHLIIPVQMILAAATPSKS